MPNRGWILIVFSVLILLSWYPCSAEESVPPSPAPISEDTSTSTTTTDIEQAKLPLIKKEIFYGDFSVTADHLEIRGSNDDLQKMTATGNVQIKWGLAAQNAKPIAVTFNATSLVIDSTENSTGKDIKIATIKDAQLSTCTEPVNHQHYGIRAKSFILYPDQHFEARHISFYVAGTRLFTLPKYRGSFAKTEKTSTLPALTFGTSTIDGTYVGTGYQLPLNSDYTLGFNTRFGTKELLRGGVTLSRPISLSDRFGVGTMSVVAAWHEDVQNRLVSTDSLADARLEDLTISRLPAVQFAFDPVTLIGSESHQFTIRTGAGLGRYHEDPTNVTKTRAQAWGIIDSPKYKIGPLLLSGEAGVRGAFYGNDTHTAFAAQLSLQTPPTSRIYANTCFLYRREAGNTPFLFDRVLIPDELYTEVEVPIGKKTPWSLGLSNRQDLTVGKSRSMALTAIYSTDCLSYGLTYDTAEKGFKFGVVMNGMGSFRKGVGSLAFTQ